MPYFTTSQDWFKQSALLLSARPDTTRITTKYTLPNPSKAKPKKPRKISKAEGDTPPAAAAAAAASESELAAKPTVATLTLKTYDPASGVCLKYRTDKGAEVGRLIASLGKLGRGMLGGEVQIEEDVAMADAQPVESKEVKEAAGGQAASSGGGGGGGGGGKKKRKGKK